MISKSGAIGGGGGGVVEGGVEFMRGLGTFSHCVSSWTYPIPEPMKFALPLHAY